MVDKTERRVLIARRAEKVDRLKRLELRASSLLVQIRRDLGGGYLESLAELRLDRAEDTLAQLRQTVERAAALESQIEELTQLLGA